MQKPILGIDFDGTIIRSSAGIKAHSEWFRLMALALHKPSIAKYAGIKDYFPNVYEVLKEYTGLNNSNPYDKIVLRKFARNLFQMCYLHEINTLKETIVFKELVVYLQSLQKQYTLALITTAPEDSVIPILEITSIKDVFDIVYPSKLTEEPQKKELLQSFSAEYQKPRCYIGNTIEDEQACSELNIPCIIVTWDRPKEKFKCMAKTVPQLRKILSTVKKIE